MSEPKSAGGGVPPPASSFRGWTRLLVIVAVFGIIIYLAPNLERVPGIGPVITIIRESGIEAGAWYYDDVQEVFEAMDYMRERLDQESGHESRQESR